MLYELFNKVFHVSPSFNTKNKSGYEMKIALQLTSFTLFTAQGKIKKEVKQALETFAMRHMFPMVKKEMQRDFERMFRE